MSKVDKSGRLSSPRAARELALLILYAECLEGSEPIRLFEKRVNARREPEYEFDKNSLLEYNDMSFGGPPVKTETIEEEDELVHHDETESNIKAEVLSAPSEIGVQQTCFTNAPAGRILEFSILHLGMSEVAVLGIRHPIVIMEAVDLARRFCDGSAPRIINGCLRTFVKDRAATTPQYYPTGLL